MIKLWHIIALVLVGVAGAAGAAVDHVTRGHPRVRHAVYAIENEATRLARKGLSATGKCGVERWPEKTLALHADPASAAILAERSQLTNVPKLRSIPVPDQRPKDGTRVPAEAVLDRLTGVSVTAYKLELDSDVHLVLKSALDGSTMIAEIPDPGCIADDPTAAADAAKARTAFQAAVYPATPAGYYQVPPTPIRLSITGPPFLDFVHGQKGVAPNGVEIHPVVMLRVIR